MDPIEAFFNHPDPVEKHNREVAFQAFKARLIQEVKVDGGTNQGVVWGHLESKR